MNALIRNPKDFWTGVIFVAAGIAFIVIAQNYPIGSARRMGPAYFPTILGGLLALIGLAAAARSFVGRGEGVRNFAYKPLVLVCLATVLFGLLVRWAGLLPSVFLLVVVSASASVHFRWRSATLLGLGLAAFCIGVFVYGLGLPMPIFGPLFGG